MDSGPRYYTSIYDPTQRIALLSLGIGASTNGEAYWIDNPTLKLDLARLFFKQNFALNKNTKYQSYDII